MSNFVTDYFREFSVLKETKKEFWGLQFINVIDCIAYFSMVNIMTVALTENFGFSDIDAGQVYALFYSGTTCLLFFSGVISDWLGIKLSLYASCIGPIIFRALIVMGAYMPPSTTRTYLVVGSFFMLAPFMALMQTVFQAANKRFTTKRSRGAGFNLWYLFMNIGAAGGGYVVDLFYLELKLPRYSIFTLGAGLGIICTIATLFLVRNTNQLGGDGEEEVEEKKISQSPLAIAKAVISDTQFWRFLVLIFFLLGVRAVFLYQAILAPKYWLRVIGEDARIGLLQSLNPILICIGMIVFIPILNKFSLYKMLIVGAFITSLSILALAIPPFGGAEIGAFAYQTTFIYIILLTVGELIWSPRFQEYTAAVAPKGQEGTYFGLAMVPYFFTSMIVSMFSGHMLGKWCPEGIGEKLKMGQVAYTDSPYMMWFVLGSIALVGTCGALFLKNWFTASLPKSEKEKASQKTTYSTLEDATEID